jgi:DNA polymerase III subunit delta
VKRQELDAALQRGTLPNAVMLFGESHFLIDRYLRRIADVPEASLIRFYHDEYDFESAKSHLSQGSLFGDRSVLVIKNEKKVPKKELDTLVALCQKNPDNLFVYGYYGSDFKTSDKAFNKKAGGTSVRLFNPFFGEAKTILMQEAQRLGVQLDQNAAFHLLNAQNNDLSLACNELEKLRILDKPIGAREIDELVYGLADIKIEQLINKLLGKQEFKEDLQHLIESGEDEIRILTALSGFITQLYLFYAYIKLHGSADSSQILGYRLPGYIEKERTQLCIRFQQNTYEAMLELLVDAELKMKSSGNVDKNTILLATLLRLQTLL